MHIRVTLPEQTVETRTTLIKNLTETVWNILQLPDDVRQLVSVHLDVYGKNEMGRGGKINPNGLPVYHIDLYAPVLNYEQKRELCDHLTTAFCDTLGLEADKRRAVAVLIHQFGAENSAIGGRLISELAHV